MVGYELGGECVHAIALGKVERGDVVPIRILHQHLVFFFVALIPFGYQDEKVVVQRKSLGRNDGVPGSVSRSFRDLRTRPPLLDVCRTLARGGVE